MKIAAVFIKSRNFHLNTMYFVPVLNPVKSRNDAPSVLYMGQINNHFMRVVRVIEMLEEIIAAGKEKWTTNLVIRNAAIFIQATVCPNHVRHPTRKQYYCCNNTGEHSQSQVAGPDRNSHGQKYHSVSEHGIRFSVPG